MCSINRSYNTSYNGNLEVPPYTGLMFEVTARSEPVIINAFELDLRLENATDLSIEVYSLQGSFAEKFDQPSEWTLVADTEVVLSAGGGGIVPVQKFAPVRIDTAERQSFYITMKGPYLDHNVDALQKTGELQSKGDDLQVYVGAGLTEYRFPDQLDTILDPMFAGVIHYEKEYNCDQVPTATAYFDFPVLFQESVGNMVDVTTAIDDALGEIFKNDPEIKSFVANYDLSKSDGQTEAVTYTHSCPTAWDECPKSYLHSTFRLVHKDTLKQGKVLFEIYRSTDRIMEYVRNRTPGIQSVYIGFESTAAEYRLTLAGVPAGAVMDDIQQDYFVETTKRFLVEAIRVKGTVFDIQIDSQEIISRRLLGRSLVAGLEDGNSVSEEDGHTRSLKVQGVIQGALPATIRKNEFRFALISAFTTGDEVYLNMLSEGSHLPGPINEDDEYRFFQNIARVSSHFITMELAGSDETGEPSSKSPIAGIVGGVVAGVALVLAIFFLYRHRKQQKRHKLEAEEYRKRMKEERREKRLMRANSKLSVELGDDQLEQPMETALERPKAALSVGSTISSTESQKELHSAPPVFDSNGFPISSALANNSTSYPANFEPQGHNPASLGKFLESSRNAPKTKQEFDARSLPAVLQNSPESAASLMSGARKARKHQRSKEVNGTRSVCNTKSAQAPLPSLQSTIETPGGARKARNHSKEGDGTRSVLSTKSAQATLPSLQSTIETQNRQRSKEVDGTRSVRRTKSAQTPLPSLQSTIETPGGARKAGNHQHSKEGDGTRFVLRTKSAQATLPSLQSTIEAQNHQRSTEADGTRSVRRTNSAQATLPSLQSTIGTPGGKTNQQSDTDSVSASSLMSGTRSAKGNKRSKEVDDARSGMRRSPSSNGKRKVAAQQARRLQHVHSDGSMQTTCTPQSSRSTRTTVKKASSCRPPQSPYSPGSRRRPARPPPRAPARRAHSLGDIPDWLKDD